MKTIFEKSLDAARRICRRLPLLLQKRPDPMAVRSDYGIWLWPNPDDITFKLYVRGSYGRYFLKYLRAQSTPFVFMDIGANQGLYAILAARNPHCAQVFAFEPVSATADIMARNLILNDATNVTICRKAISDFSGSSAIHTQAAHSGAATLRPDVLTSAQTTSVDVMDAADLSVLVPADDLRIVVKIDVEGHEMTVLQQLLKTDFSQRLDVIFYECDEAWVDPLAIQNMLSDHGFSTFNKVGEDTHYDVLATR